MSGEAAHAEPGLLSASVQAQETQETSEDPASEPVNICMCSQGLIVVLCMYAGGKIRSYHWH